jgi:hypothetical protein
MTTMTDGIDTSGQALIAFLKKLGDDGDLKSNTANSLKASATQVLTVLPDWQTLDMRGLNVDDTFRKFVNKRSAEFKGDSLEAYKRRFTQVVKKFLEYADDPVKFKWQSEGASTKRDNNKKTSKNLTEKVATDAEPATERAPAPVISGLVEYPFPLREGRPVYLRLPMDLKLAEVARLNNYLKTLAVDSEVA